jgi:hypothetical protein
VLSASSSKNVHVKLPALRPGVPWARLGGGPGPTPRKDAARASRSVDYSGFSVGRTERSTRICATCSSCSRESFLISSARFPSRRPRSILLKKSCADLYRSPLGKLRSFLPMGKERSLLTQV